MPGIVVAADGVGLIISGVTYCPYAARARSASNHAVEKPIAYDPPPGKTNVKRECVPRTTCEALAFLPRACRTCHDRYVVEYIVT